MSTDPKTEELRVEQLKRAEEEREHADEAPTDEGTDQHEARAAKAEYLRQRLDERADAERRKGSEERG